MQKFMAAAILAIVLGSSAHAEIQKVTVRADGMC